MSKKAKQEKVKVLYQNLNGVWYAFADTVNGVFFGRVPVSATAPSAEEPKTKTKGRDAA